MSYDSKIIEFQRLAKELGRKKPKITGKKFQDETVHLDFVHHDICEFLRCELIVNYGILSLTGCTFDGCKFSSDKDSPASGAIQLDRMLRDSGSLPPDIDDQPPKKDNIVSAPAPGRFSKWCEKEPLVCNDPDLIRKSRLHLSNRDFTDYEKWIYFLHELVNCEGIEFVAFSNVLLYRQTALANNVILTPCFYPETEGMSITDPLVKLSMNMRMRGRYIYDGWIPIDDWDIENVRQAINSIEQVLSTFSLQGRNWFRWEPKYYQNEGKPNTTIFKDENVREIENFNAYLDEVSNITASIGKSAAWLNQSIRTDEPAAKFLFSFLAIESLISYIESSKSDNILHTLKSGEMSPEEKIFCIEQLIETTFSESPIETIKNAYFDCVRSLSEKLRKNIESIFGKGSEEYNMLFNDKIEGSTLYDIRHKIAHGGLNALEDVEKYIIKKRIWDMEKMSRKYLNKVIERISGNKYFQVETIKSISFPFMIGSHRHMWTGPVHMAYFYT